jgi:primosomal protein N' (replication factor Y)
VVQTYYPDHYAVLAATKHDYNGFVERELKYRRWMHYPPFGVLANVLIQSEHLEDAARWAAELGRGLEAAKTDGIRILGPCTAPIARIKSVYRFHLILKAASRKILNTALRAALAHAESAGVPRRNVTIDVDAQRLM